MAFKILTTYTIEAVVWLMWTKDTRKETTLSFEQKRLRKTLFIVCDFDKTQRKLSISFLFLFFLSHGIATANHGFHINQHFNMATKP